MRLPAWGHSLSASLLVLALASPASALTLTVRKDGSGQFSTINAAKAVAVTGDIIEVGPGTYPEEIDFSIAVTLVSTDGAGTTILDGDGIRRVLVFRAGTGSVVDGFTIRDGYHVSSGGGLRVQLGATATVRNCVFEGNHVDFDGGAVICRDPGSRLDMVDCVLRNNTADHHAGGVVIVEAGRASFDRCRFESNSGYSGAIATNTGSVYSVTNCLFTGNSGTISAIYSQASTSTIVGNTFHANSAPGGSTIYMLTSTLTFQRNIVANNTPGQALSVNSTAQTRSCNLFWNNAANGVALGPTEVASDPLFCDPANGEFTVSIHSAAAPAHSPCGELMGAFATDCDIEGPPPPPPVIVEPVILTIADIPNDEGGQVRIRWERSDYDAVNQPYVITGYAVYRYQGEGLSTVSIPQAPRAARNPHIDEWDYITTVPARGDDIYQVVAPTLCDKPHHGPTCWSVFFVSALTPNPLVYFDSEPDSGWSDDNTPPNPPSALVVAVTPESVELNWEPSPSPDVALYRIYRAIGADPVPGALTLVQSVDNPGWEDPQVLVGARYVVSAVDEGGNESNAVGSDAPTGVDNPVIPNRFQLFQNAPNPFNPTTSITFDVPPGGGHVSIEIFDVTGRRVRSLLDEDRAPGTWRVQWDGTTDRGTHASSGVYFYRLRAPRFEQTKRMTLLE